MKLNIGGIIMTALVILAVVYAYNRFSGKNVADLGRTAA